MKKLIFIILLFVSIVILFMSFDPQPQKLTIGFVPYKSSTSVLESFKKIKAYLEKEMQIKIELTVAEDYLALIQSMKQKKVDIGMYGPFSYIAGESELKLAPLVADYRKGSGATYYSMIVVRKDSGISSIDDLKGKNFVFVDPGSTSGHVIPFAMFKSRDIDVDQYFSSTRYAGSHDAVALSVLDGKADAGSMDDIVFKQLVESGKIKESDLDILWKSKPIPTSPYVARADLSDKLKQKFKAAMLSIDKKDPGALFYYAKDTQKFVECNKKSYNVIRNIAEILGHDYMIDNFLKGK